MIESSLPNALISCVLSLLEGWYGERLEGLAGPDIYSEQNRRPSQYQEQDGDRENLGASILHYDDQVLIPRTTAKAVLEPSIVSSKRVLVHETQEGKDGQ